ncbi:hypothetical protein NPL7_01485 [Metamycoplasma hyosynoviae]|uniref:leucine-rich repeat protein n=1 Tax=Metamycoplasma hyosynoviae TaxID=29559 RepID=UPI0004618602|nr:leucine-rich repeat protein [Metamycoplasma hyosynoviae]KDE41950.1 hypothetical protein NPL3_02645 [Metamycoplasma hyosynoviae]KDE41997.1 hypothetical protein NPL7_01485 [Metamycoplasma hyosynoviae]KDE43358.1 hypothetical protein NPL5_02355 [Metamycoplasma hyosynoviae]KDE43836.1 hypothetical protein NPL6_03075 [Metamycoplasma hyosynoviae]KDE45164.1 hypothetical protein NPL4_02355 [Metamycoplasma hyosynoviae]
MKEQEQKKLNNQEAKPQSNQDKVKTQNPKTKVIVWSTAGAAAAALSSIITLTTVFSNQRKVSFLDKVLQSLKIDVKDKDTKTKDDIKTIADFVASGLNNKLYELIVETEENEVNKQPLDKDKPYTTFRTKFALRNKFTKAQSNYQSFEFRDIKPPKEKTELDKLGQISLNEKDRINDKVKIEFLNFNRNIKLASEVAAKDENGKFKYFNIYLKQDNDDALQYEIVNVNVETNDETSTAIFSYQIKVKSIDDDKFTSNVLKIEFKDFAKTSTQLTQYLNELTFSYENVEQIFIQDAVQSKVIAKNNGVDLPSNYELIFTEFKTEGEHPKKINAKVRIRDNVNNIISDARDIEITGFKKYLTPEELDAYIDQIELDVEDKNNKFISNINNHSEIKKSKFDDDKYEIDLGTFLVEKLSDLVSINVHFRIKEKNGRPGIYSKQASKTITGFKMPQELVENLAQKVEFDVTSKSTKMAYEFWDKFDDIDVKTKDERIDFITSEVKVKQTDADKITITYKVKDKKNDTTSKEYSKTIDGFKTSTDNTTDFSYEIIAHNGHKVAFLNERKNLSQYKVPAKIGSYKVIKVGTLFSGVNRAHSNGSPLYGVVLEEGIQEVSNLIISSDYGEEYAKIAAIKLPKSIKKITSLINGDSSSLAYLEMYDNVETIEGQLFTTFCNYKNKNEKYTAKGIDYATYYFNLIHEFSSFFNVETPDHGRYGMGSFKFNLLESNETKKLKLNNNAINEFSFLESFDGKNLYKIVDNKESIKDFNVQLNYETISKNAFSGLNIEKIDLHLPHLDGNQQKNFILERMKNLHEIKLTHHKFDQFPMSKLLNDITSLKNITFPDFSSDSFANILEFSLNGKSEKVNLPTNTREIKARIIDANNIENLKNLTKLEILHKNSFIHFKNTTLDFSNCPIKEIKHAAFHWSTEGVSIILPGSINKVDPFILYFTEKNEKYYIVDNPFDYADQLSQIELTGIINVTIEVKGVQSKPNTWSEYWVGQYWKNNQVNGIENQLKIKWGN